VLPSTAMINIPPRHYCVVGNPHHRGEVGASADEHGQVRLQWGEHEVRLFHEWDAPFPLYPGEFLKEGVTMLTVVKEDAALRLYALRDFEDGDLKRHAGDEWLFKGPGTYHPRREVQVLQPVESRLIKLNQALRLRAKRDLVDSTGKERKVGEEWLVTQQGSYMPGVHEEDAGIVKAVVLTEKTALHLEAKHNFTDVYGYERKAGSEWLISLEQTQTHIPGVHEIARGEVRKTTLTKQQYCVVLNPVDEAGVPQLGLRQLRVGERNFFLQPGESMENGRPQHVKILGEDEALLLRAREQYDDTDEKGEPVTHQPGDIWMIYGPRKFVPAVDVEILEARQRIPLDENEGIYVRNKQTGTVRSMTGQSYMLKPNEELWDKVLPAEVEKLVQEASKSSKRRILNRVVAYRVPHSSAVQIYDYKKKNSRVVFGPALVMLEPDEQFSILSLSGGDPKQPNAFTTLAMPLGPDFMNDTVVVETSDHARLKLSLSYNWRFEYDENNPKHRSMIFSVRDFIGDTCKAIASRVRGAVAARPFEDFHKNSAMVIREAVFGHVEGGEIGEKLVFNANLLAVTNVDVQSVEPVEQRTRDALQKSVQLAIEIATSSQEALASHDAQREEAAAKGKLAQQKIRDRAAAEDDRKLLVKLKAETTALESTGQAKAEAIARSEAALIKGRAAVKQATLKAEALHIRSSARLTQLGMRQEQELTHRKALDKLEIERKTKEADIESKKFKQIIDAIGSDTIEAIARAGPEMQAKLLEGLGLQGFLVTDGSSPINLFNTAQGLVSGQ